MFVCGDPSDPQDRLAHRDPSDPQDRLDHRLLIDWFLLWGFLLSHRACATLVTRSSSLWPVGRNTILPLLRSSSRDLHSPCFSPPCFVARYAFFIMSSRVTKTRSRKASQRDLLVSLIAADCDEVMPCSACHQRKQVCRMGPKSSRCLECVRRGRSCSGTSVASARESYSSHRRPHHFF